MDPVRAGRIASAMLLLAAIAAAFWHLGLGIVVASGAVGMAMLTLSQRRQTQQDFSELLHDLNLKGPGHHVPVPNGVRLFIPADPRGPYLMPDVRDGAIHRDPPGSIGFAMQSPGHDLLEAWRQLEGLPLGQGVEEATRHMHRAMKHLQLGDRVKVEQNDSGFRIHARLRDDAAAEAAHASGWNLQGGGPEASLLLSLLALALNAPIRTEQCNLEPGRILRIEAVMASTA